MIIKKLVKAFCLVAKVKGMGVDHPLLKSDSKIIWRLQYFWMRYADGECVRTIKHVEDVRNFNITIEYHKWLSYFFYDSSNVGCI